MSSAARKKIVEETLNRIIGNLKRGRRSKELKKNLLKKGLNNVFDSLLCNVRDDFHRILCNSVLSTENHLIVTGDEKANAVNSK